MMSGHWAHSATMSDAIASTINTGTRLLRNVCFWKSALINLKLWITKLALLNKKFAVNNFKTVVFIVLFSRYQIFFIVIEHGYQLI